MSWSTTKGFEFRGSSGYVTTATNDTYVLAADTYPTTRSIGGENVTFGLESAPTGALDRTTSSPNNPKLAGIHYINDASGDTEFVFRVDLPATGDYSIRLASGDYPTGHVFKFQLLDNATAFVTRTEEAPSPADYYCDASGVTRTSATAWFADNVSVERTFASTIFRCAMQRPSTSFTAIAYIEITQVGAPPGATFIPLIGRGPGMALASRGGGLVG